MREEMHRFSEAEVVPHAQEWHLKDEYVPMELIGQMAELGVFALTLGKVFLVDMAQLEAIYRIGSFYKDADETLAENGFSPNRRPVWKGVPASA